MTRGEQDVILDVEGQAAGAATLAFEGVCAGDLECLSVDDGDLIHVFEIDKHFAVAVGDGLLGLSAEIERANDGTILGIDDGGVGGSVTEDPDALVEAIEQYAVGATLDIDGLDEREGLGIPHGDWAAE